MTADILEKNKLRSLARIMSNSTISKLVKENNNYAILDNLYVDDLGDSEIKYEDLFSYSFKILSKHYRNEYVYKNFIVNKILLGKHSLNTTIALNEFKIGDSIADIVLINGSSKVFEIKTELDSDVRIESQIENYKKVFSEIYVVTHESLFEKYNNILTWDIGIIVLTKANSLRTKRKAIPNTEFDNASIMNCLRKKEYSNIITEFYGSLPDVQPIKFYRECLKLFMEIPSKIAQSLMVNELKKRKLRCQEMLNSESIPFELRSICLNLDFNEKEYLKLEKILKQSIT